MTRAPALDSLRFFGAFSVILLHLQSKEWFSDWGLSQYHILISGLTGVTLFYVISGYLITRLALEEVSRTGGFSTKNFLIRRALRLFPLYYLAILFLFCVEMAGVTRVKDMSYAYALTYTYNFVPREYYSTLLGSFHTLATEEQFYLAFACVFGFTLWKRSVGFAALLLAGLIFLPMLWDSFTAYQDTHYVYRWVIFASSPILIGCLGAWVAQLPFVGDLESKARSGWIYRHALGFGLLAIFLGFYLGQVWQKNEVTLSIGFLALVHFLATTPTSRLARVLSYPPLVYLGTISYGLYVWQSVIIGTSVNSRWVDPPIVAVAVVFGLAYLSYELYEKPFLKLKSRFTRRSE